VQLQKALDLLLHPGGSPASHFRRRVVVVDALTALVEGCLPGALRLRQGCEDGAELALVQVATLVSADKPL
jgi:hypothetical protein